MQKLFQTFAHQEQVPLLGSLFANVHSDNQIYIFWTLLMLAWISIFIFHFLLSCYFHFEHSLIILIKKLRENRLLMNLQKKYLLQIARRIRQHLTFSHIPIRGYISELQYARSLRAITSFPGSSFHRKEAVSHNDTDSCMAAKNCISRGEAACKIFSKLT